MRSATASPDWFTVSLGAACVVPGATQSLQVRTRDGFSVTFDSTYADGRHGDAYGGRGVRGGAGGTTAWRWTVSPSAPTGTVTVAVGTQRDGAPPRVHQVT